MTAMRDRHGHRLELVVGDVDHRLADARCSSISSARMWARSLASRLRERLVEQEDVRVRAPGPGRAPRAAAGRRRAGAACASSSGSSCSSWATARDLRRPLGLRHAALPQRIGDVLRHRHVRIERVGLEHHGDVALGRREVVDDAVAEADGPARSATRGRPACASVVVLPQPDGPSRLTNSPGCDARGRDRSSATKRAELPCARFRTLADASLHALSP